MNLFKPVVTKRCSLATTEFLLADVFVERKARGVSCATKTTDTSREGQNESHVPVRLWRTPERTPPVGNLAFCHVLDWPVTFVTQISHPLSNYTRTKKWQPPKTRREMKAYGA